MNHMKKHRSFTTSGKALSVLLTCFHLLQCIAGFVRNPSPHRSASVSLPYLQAAKGFGASSSESKGTKKKSSRLADTLADKKKKKASANKPFVRSEQDQLIAALAERASKTCIGQAVANAPQGADPFWELIPSLILSRFPTATDNQLQRVAGFLRHAVDPNLPVEDHIINDPYRPQHELHAYMPGLGESKPFYDPSTLTLCKLLSENYDTIKSEYDALIADMENSGNDRFQSVTSLNYDSGWKTLVLFYNGHRIPKFPYHLCPTTTKILETVPIAGRIAGFNRQQPNSGIPLHTDGNNMWLTCQMGIYVPEGEKAYIRVGPEKRYWKPGECLLYDTTYEHETRNDHPTEARVVLHVDFFNILAMTPLEIEVMEYIYALREQFMKAEGVAKVDSQTL